MSAHRIYCYAQQRPTVVEYLRSLGAIVTLDSPHAIHAACQLQGLDHITFIVVDGHRSSVPEDMWNMIKVQGAIVIHFDDQFLRGKLSVRHHVGEARVFAEQGAN